MAAKKPEHRRQRRNSRDIGLVAVSGGAEAPDSDSCWLDSTAERWVSFWSADVAGVAEPDSDLPALRRLFGYYDEHERAVSAFRGKRFVEGSQGQPRLNPLSKYLLELEGAIRQLEDRFGLTPSARLKLGVDFASAHKSLEELNRSLANPEEEADDPRLEVIEGAATD